MNSEPISFRPLADVSPPVWHKPVSFAFAHHVSQIPLSDSELLLTSSCLPIAIDCISDRPRVVAIIDPRFQRTPAIGPNGQWQRGYLPLALRCLPFRLASGDSIEVATNLPHDGGPGVPLFDGPELSPEVKAMAGMLRRLEDGKKHLQHAAAQLLIAGMLTPIRLGQRPSGDTGRSFTVSREQFQTLSGPRAALLAKDSFLAIDLAVACIFSQRHLATLVSVTSPASENSATAPQTLDDLMAPIRLSIQVDDQALFSYEQYRSGSAS